MEKTKDLQLENPTQPLGSTTALPRKSSVSHVNQLCQSDSARVFKYG